jgi:hypothetical protein
MTTTEQKRQRKSPETRLAPLAMLVLEEPMPVSAKHVERRFSIRVSTETEGEGLAGRRTPIAEAMVGSVPRDGHWYLAAICYSAGQTTALSSHIARCGYGRRVDVATGLVANRAARDGQREQYFVFLRRKPGKSRVEGGRGGDGVARPTSSRARSQHNRRQGGSAMAGIPADRTQYRLNRRYKSKKGGKPLKGFALDVTVRFNTYGTPFVQDHNGDVMPFNDLGQAQRFISDWMEQNYKGHSGKK